VQVPHVRRVASLVGTAVVAATLLAAMPAPSVSGTETAQARGTAIACPPGEAPPTAFADSLRPFEDEVRCLVGHGIARGRDARSYDVGTPVTRAQLASLTHATLAAAGAAPTWDGVARFSDVGSRGTHVREIGALSGPAAGAAGPVLEGFTDGTFRPQRDVTRAQAASIIDRAVRTVLPTLQPPAVPGCSFSDGGAIAPVHRAATTRLCAFGIAQGRADGRFAPDAQVTRGQATAFLARALDLFADQGQVTSPFPVAVEVVTDGLEAPWDLVRTAAGRWFVTERDSGRVLELVEGRAELRRTFSVDATNSNGLLGLTEGPTGLLYAYLTTATDNRVVRFDPDGGPIEPVVTDLPKGTTHAGGRLAFGPDGMLYVGTGDVTANGPSGDVARLRAQDPEDLAGKVLRLHPDGTVPADNPFDNAVWAYGFRNVQGLSFDAGGRLWATDMGHTVDDEVNRVVRGGNYGWPVATGTSTAGGSLAAAFVEQPPRASWSGLTVARHGAGLAEPGDLLVGALRGERIWRLEHDGHTVTRATSLLAGHVGRVRTVVDAGEAGLYVLTDNATRGMGPFRGDAVVRISAR
jgi:glucose/arabinose dehydrogenase